MNEKKRNEKGAPVSRRIGAKIGAGAMAVAIAVSIAALPANALAAGNAERQVAAYSASGVDYGPLNEYLKGLEERQLTVHSIKNKNVWSYQRKAVSIAGRQLSVNSLTINGKEYIPSRKAAEALGLSYNYNSTAKSVTIKGTGLEMTFSNGSYVTWANGRALFSMSPSVIMSDGRMYIPAESFAKAVGLRFSSTSQAVLLSGSYAPIVSGDKFYRSDEVFWLARIIQAESAGEPLLGQIAVGNIVLNRVKSSAYPNTIYGVIFDRKYGVQFSPVLDGSIYNTPGYSATLAAKICLDGYDVSDGTLFFLRPEHSTSSWIPKNRQYGFTIGDHDFYY